MWFFVGFPAARGTLSATNFVAKRGSVAFMLARDRATFLHVTLWMLDLLVRNNQVFHAGNSVELLDGTALTPALRPAIQLRSVRNLHVKSWSPSLALVDDSLLKYHVVLEDPFCAAQMT